LPRGAAPCVASLGARWPLLKGACVSVFLWFARRGTRRWMSFGGVEC